MERTTVKDLADRLIEGGLEAWLRDHKVNRRDSLVGIARRLDRDHQIVVTSETVRQWCLDYGIPTERPEPLDAA